MRLTEKLLQFAKHLEDNEYGKDPYIANGLNLIYNAVVHINQLEQGAVNIKSLITPDLHSFRQPKLAAYYLKLYEIYQRHEQEILKRLKHESEWSIAVNYMRDKKVIDEEIDVIWDAFNAEETAKLEKIREKSIWEAGNND